MTTDILTLVAGLVALYLGAAALVRGGVGMAARLRVRAIVIGLTVIAVGTSLPELTIAVVSSAKGASGISIGNIVGSNICNILLILGISALIRPLPIEKSTLRRNIPVAIAAAASLWILAADGFLNRFDGLILLSIYATFIAYTLSRKSKNIAAGYGDKPSGKSLKYGLLILVGFALLIYGGSATVKGGMAIAEMLGIPESIVALTIIALGTSLPELATCAVASYKAQSDIAMGNILGSNICNSLLIVGIAAVIHPFALDAGLLSFSFPVMLLASAAILPFSKSGMSVS
ncbi:calcium/sodium antiporter, partial [bacterium]|nr:calcium/sodium antiporter [bacterium]